MISGEHLLAKEGKRRERKLNHDAEANVHEYVEL